MTEAEESSDERTTAPQSDYGPREIAIGLAVFVIGAVVAFGIPIAMTL